MENWINIHTLFAITTLPSGNVRDHAPLMGKAFPILTSPMSAGMPLTCPASTFMSNNGGDSADPGLRLAAGSLLNFMVYSYTLLKTSTLITTAL